MEKLFLKKLGAVFLLFISLLTNFSCVNSIESDIVAGNIPIKFKTKVTKPDTKVIDNTFEKGDAVGLFATLSTTTIKEKRYIDNLKLEYGESSLFVPEKEIFYPEGDASLDFISYYPFHSLGTEANSSLIPVSVQTNQNIKEKYSLSDFLVATATNISSEVETVELNFRHKFAKLNIILSPKPGEAVDEMKKANPRITITGLKTGALYDLEEDQFFSLEKEADITAYGEWSISDGKLVGKQIIFIPQDIDSNNQFFIIDWNGKIYTCPLPKLSMNDGTQCDVTISAAQSTNQTLTGVAGKISEWVTVESKYNTENSYDITAIHPSALSFSLSDVYRVYHQGSPVAEICKEYLSASDNSVNSRAIVAYPVNSNEKTDFTQGTILRLLDKEGEVHGGTVSWETTTNSLRYTPGTSKPIEKFYINDEKKIVLEKPDAPLVVNIACYTLRDIRKGSIQEYPIVKIGTQYWMKENLRTTIYADGSSIEKLEMLQSAPGYLQDKGQAELFYNGEAILTGKIAPDKWRIPKEKDWELLKTYINDDASLLKTGEWAAIIVDKIPEKVYPSTNLTGFSAYPVGTWMTQYGNTGKMTGFWTLDNTGTKIPEKTFFLPSNTNQTYSGNSLMKDQNYYIGISIRCIKD